MNRKTRRALGMATIVFASASVAALAQGSSMMQAQIAQSQDRVQRLTQDLIEMDEHIEKNVNQLISLMAGVRDSPETGTEMVSTKENILVRLGNSIDTYQRQRQSITGGPNSPWQQRPTAGQQQTLELLDELTERRVDQIVELASSLATHEDFEKYTIERRTQIKNYKRTVSDDYRNNKRVTAKSEPLRETVVEEGRESIANLERQAADLERQIRAARTPDQRADLEDQLAAVDERLSTRRNQVDEVAETYPPNTRQVGRDEASEIMDFIDDEVRQIQEDFRRLQMTKSNLDHERNRLRSLQMRAAASGG